MPLQSTRRTRGSVNKSQTINGMPDGLTRPESYDSLKISKDALNALMVSGKKEIVGLIEDVRKSLKPVLKDMSDIAKDMTSVSFHQKKSDNNDNNINANNRKSSEVVPKKQISNDKKALLPLLKNMPEIFGNSINKGLDGLDKSLKSITGSIDKMTGVMLDNPVFVGNELTDYLGEMKKDLVTKREKDIYRAFNGQKTNTSLMSGNMVSKPYLDSIASTFNRMLDSNTEQGMKLRTSYAEANMSDMEKLVDKYDSAIQELVQAGYQAYGNDFMNNKNFLTEYKALEVAYGKQFKDQIKADKKEKFDRNIVVKAFRGVKDTLGSLPKQTKESVQGLLGPLNFIVEPIKEFFGGTIGKLFTFIGGGIKNLFGKFTNKKPTASEVLKKGGQAGLGAVYMGNILQKVFGGGEEEGFLSKLFGKGNWKNLLSDIGAYGLIGAGIGTMVLDGISAMGMSEEWGVSDKSAFIGGLLGGTEKGWKNALKKAGEGALLGAGIGLKVGGLTGLVVGAILGGALFGICGFIGGEKISQWIEDITKKIEEDPSIIAKAIVGLLAGALAILAVKNAIGQALAPLISGAISGLSTGTAVNSSFKTAFTKIGGYVVLAGVIASMVYDGIQGIAKAQEWGVSESEAFIGAFFGGTGSGWANAFAQGAKGALAGATIGSMICPPLGTIVGGLLGAGIMGALGYIGGEEISKDLHKMGESLGEFFSNPAETIQEASSKKETYQTLQEKAKAKGIKTVITLKSGEAVPEGFVKSSQLGGNVYSMTEEHLRKLLGVPTDEELKNYTPVTDFKDERGLTLNWRDLQLQNMKNGSTPTIGVNDAIIWSNGSIVRTSPEDNIIATKNLPTNIDSLRINDTKELNKSLSEAFGMDNETGIKGQMNKLVSLMSQLVNKEPVSISLPNQNRADLELLMAGGGL